MKGFIEVTSNFQDKKHLISVDAIAWVEPPWVSDFGEPLRSCAIHMKSSAKVLVIHTYDEVLNLISEAQK
jgi:hypothetical protein